MIGYFTISLAGVSLFYVLQPCLAALQGLKCR
jgi:hypothetical protein